MVVRGQLPFVEALRAAFDTVEPVMVSYRNDLVDEEHTDWLFLAWDERPQQNSESLEIAEE